MEIKTTIHKNVQPNGRFSDKPGAIHTERKFYTSPETGGCGIPTCNCSPGFWATQITPRTWDGTVEVITITFEDKQEMENFLAKRRFHVMFNIGKSKYVINYHDGIKKHKDGSDFFDIALFKNKKRFAAYQNELKADGYKETGTYE